MTTNSHKLLHNTTLGLLNLRDILSNDLSTFIYSFPLHQKRSFLKRPVLSGPVFLIASSQLKSLQCKQFERNSQFNNQVFVWVAVLWLVSSFFKNKSSFNNSYVRRYLSLPPPPLSSVYCTV